MREWSWLTWLKLAAGVALLVAAIIGHEAIGGFVAREWRNAVYAAEHFQPALLLLAIPIYGVGVVLTFFRWYLLVRAQHLPFTVAEAMQWGIVGYVISQFTPGSVSGDLVKAGCLAAGQTRRTAAVTTILVDRFVGLYTLFLLASLVGCLFYDVVLAQRDLRIVIISIWAITAAATVGMGVIALPAPWERLIGRLRRLPAVGNIAAELVTALRQYRHHASMLGRAMLVGVGAHGCFVTAFYVAALSVPGPTPSLPMQFLIVPVGLVLQAVPLAPANLGVNELLFKTLYLMVGPEYEKGVLVSLATRVVTLAIALVGLVWYWPLRRRIRQIALATSQPPENGAS